jgi:hypothetical protein
MSDIIQSNLERWEVEDRFRLSKDDELVGALYAAGRTAKLGVICLPSLLR